MSFVNVMKTSHTRKHLEVGLGSNVRRWPSEQALRAELGNRLPLPHDLPKKQIDFPGKYSGESPIWEIPEWQFRGNLYYNL
jgi:hypothetical protein